MNPLIKAEWVAALRSGDYQQNTQATLRTSDDRFCCLGVLCELAVGHGVINTPTRLDSEGYAYADHESASLPEIVQDWSGLRSGYGRLPSGRTLAYMNDGGTPFVTLADIIEAEL